MASSAVTAASSASVSNADSLGYEAAIHALNHFQSNAAYIERAKQHRQVLNQRSQPDAKAYLAAIRAADSPERPAPPVLHVAGTKGKGSTCAFSEALLRAQGLRTGLYTSPHLVEVRERIRLDGQPLSKESFAHYFWQVHDRLSAFTRSNCRAVGVEPDDMEAVALLEFDIEDSWRPPLRMPTYFRFLTLMALHVFSAEAVDVSVLEVGIGGRYDCTNAADGRKLAVVVTSLGIDHVSMLGDTVEQIAWHKAGIMRPSCPTITCQQPGASLGVLEAEAATVACSLWLCPPLEAYGTPNGRPLPRLGIDGDVQRINASLALQAVRFFLASFKDGETKQAALQYGSARSAPGWQLSNLEVGALTSVNWPGRHQIIEQQDGRLRYFLDGAHTPESMEHTVRWFEAASTDNSRRRVLLFNITGERSPESLLKYLADARSGRLFSAAVFCPNVVYTNKKSMSDLRYRLSGGGGSEARSVAISEVWSHMLRAAGRNDAESGLPNALYYVCFSLEEALAWIEAGAGSTWRDCIGEKVQQTDVLITGSLHLIGCALKLLVPNMWR